MSLTWKDAITTLIMVAILAAAFITTKDNQTLFSGHWRWGVAALLLAGIAMCIFSGANGVTDAWGVTAAALGVAALLLGVIGLIIGTQLWFMLLVGVLGVMWLLTTVHHLLSH